MAKRSKPVEFDLVRNSELRASSLPTSSTGIKGLDEISGGSLPRGRTKIVCGGQTPKSLAALSNLKRICAKHLDGKYELEVIDLIKNPRLAQGDQILAIPTLVRNLPVPIRKIIGDLSNVDRVLVGLDLRGTGPAPEKKPPLSENAMGAKL